MQMITKLVGWLQCDQIWKNFDTWANFQNHSETIEAKFSVSQNFESTLIVLL